VNIDSGQTLRFRGYEAKKSDIRLPLLPEQTKVWHFSYEDGNQEYPLVVSLKVEVVRGALRYIWIIDHESSRAEWQNLAYGQTRPSFGLWQRVNDCAVDALLCWPESENTGPKPTSIVSSAGWFNGAWSSQIRQRRDRGHQNLAGRGMPVTPFLQDIDAISHSWRFIDASRARAGAELSYVKEIADGQFYLPVERQLTGFEYDVPHLRRDDDRAVMFPSGIDSYWWRGEDYKETPCFLYADEDVFFSRPWRRI
jgi:hypothetical protein